MVERYKKYDTLMLSINLWYNRIFKIILIIGFLLILAVVQILFLSGQAPSYEFSIYSAYPWYLWIFLLSAITCGQVVIIGGAFAQSRKNYWFFGLCTILLSDAIFLFMPIIRGYYIFGDGDVLTHIGYMKDILRTSSIGEIHYPVDHILGVIIHLYSGLPLKDITFIIPPFFSFFFILSMYFVAKTIFQNIFERLILVVLSSILLLGEFHFSFTPNSQALLLVPLVIYLAFKIYDGVDISKYHFLLLLMSFLIVFYHPLVTLMVVLILSIMQFIQYIQEKYEKKILKKVDYSYTILFILTVFAFWSSYIVMAVDVAKPFISRIFGDIKTQSELQKNISLFSQVNIDPVYVLTLIFNIYGHWILLGIISLFCIGLILKTIKNEKIKMRFSHGIFVLGFVVFLVLSIAMFFTIDRFGFGRIFAFATIFSIFLIPAGIFLFIFDNSNKKTHSGKKIITMLGVILFVFCVTYFSVFNLYYSPIIKLPNIQVPKSDYIGMSTFFSHRNESLPVLEFGLFSFRYDHIINGPSARRLNFPENNYNNFIPPDHFGYQNETQSRIFYHNPKYLLINDHGKGFYPNIYPEFTDKWRYSPGDFERLSSDNQLQQVYSNSNLEIFLISPQKENGI